MTVYEKIVAIAESNKAAGYLRAYEADLTKHDQNTLANASSSQRFVWILRESGTQLFPIAAGHDPIWCTYWFATGKSLPCLTFFIDMDKESVKPITYEQARKFAKIPHPDGKVVNFSFS